MKKVILPGKKDWARLFRRPLLDAAGLEQTVRQIFHDVAAGGDEAVLRYSRKFDGYQGDVPEVGRQEWEAAAKVVSQPLKDAIKVAAGNIRRFHENQMSREKPVETFPGVVCRREYRAIDSVGLYIPGGTAPLFSTVLMLGIPASVAGCRNIFLCTPPRADGTVAPEILYAAGVAGVHRVFRAGGIQAVAAMAVGTESIPKVDKILGPGNQFVTAAKNYAQYLGTAIDMPAGPSEVLVIADQTARPEWVAADLLSQAEHGPDSQVMLITWVKELIEAVEKEVERLLPRLPRKDIAAGALEHARLILCRDAEEATEMADAYAPEHLILAVHNPEELLVNTHHAGSVFMGHYTPESAGDYASGTNHTLPTMGYARVSGGVSTEHFLKKMTVQEISPQGLKALGPVIETMAAAEQLEAHKLAVQVRLTKNQSDEMEN